MDQTWGRRASPLEECNNHWPVDRAGHIPGHGVAKKTDCIDQQGNWADGPGQPEQVASQKYNTVGTYVRIVRT